MECGVLPADLCDPGTEAVHDGSHDASYDVTHNEEDQTITNLKNLNNLKSLFKNISTEVDLFEIVSNSLNRKTGLYRKAETSVVVLIS